MVSDPIISNLNVKMDHEVQDSISLETPTCNIAAKQTLTLSDIDEDNREDDNGDLDDNYDLDDGDNSDDCDNDNEEFDLSEEEFDNEIGDENVAIRYEMYG